jgi:hypothetical protein
VIAGSICRCAITCRFGAPAAILYSAFGILAAAPDLCVRVSRDGSLTYESLCTCLYKLELSDTCMNRTVAGIIIFGALRSENSVTRPPERESTIST